MSYVKEARIFEDLHTLAHRWTQYCSEDGHVSFEQFLLVSEPRRFPRLLEIFHFVSDLEKTEEPNT